jgi:hypothetical protein
VELGFTASEWIVLSVEERIVRCRLMAREALSLASGDGTSLGPRYFDLAMRWLDLATAMQSEIGGQSQV